MNNKNCTKELANLIISLIIIYNKNNKKKINIKKMYKYLINWIYYGKYNKFILQLYEQKSNKLPIWYSGFNYSKSLKKELNILKKKFSFNSDWETFLIFSLTKVKKTREKYYTIKNKCSKKEL